MKITIKDKDIVTEGLELRKEISGNIVVGKAHGTYWDGTIVSPEDKFGEHRVWGVTSLEKYAPLFHGKVIIEG